MASFHLFTHLPPELRLEIWKVAAESQPRDVIFLRNRPQDQRRFFGYTIVTTQPAVLQVCHESRTAGTHEKAFQDGPRYLWVNFEIDTIQIPISKVRKSKKFPDRRKIINLRLIGYTHDWPMDGSPSQIDAFSRVKRCDYLLEDKALWNLSLGLGYSSRQDSPAVRVIRADTGEYITPETFFPYLFWTVRSNSSFPDEYWDEQFKEHPSVPIPKESPTEHIVPWTCPVIR